MPRNTAKKSRRRSQRRSRQPQPVAPAPPPNPGDLPAPLTIFLTQSEREQALRALGRRHRDRRLALLAALKIASDARRSAGGDVAS